jgi:predicted phage tail protein
MKTIRLYGDMGKRFGREHRFDVKTPAEAVRALCSQIQGFRSYLHEHAQSTFKVFVGGRNAHDGLQYPSSDKEIIRIAPTLQGSGAGARVVLGVVLVVVGSLVPYFQFLVPIGASMIIGGVIEMLSPTPKIKSGVDAEKTENKPSYNFNGPVNTVAQGHPVPLAYGEIMTGSAVISAGMVTV